MKELKLKIHLTTWYIIPQKFIDRRDIKIHFLFFSIEILKNKPKR